ncbi:MAG: carbohydrate kinase family protein [Armatimonadetes bacterium]|nr:carbohydrate kinase family protein [Armatimonadota bacterium]MBS1711196.1 carbohydrate kinase family protein [Armatimonadota bacterium]MBX3108870.1 carbohydrate kinase family protein [Fimbriimonadaceae bacterium]
MITVFGTLCLDRLHKVPNLPKPGGYVEIGSTALAVGGEGYNTAFALQKWGHPHTFLANSIGTGMDFEVLRGLLESQGLHSAVVADPGQTTPVCDIYVTPDGERTMFGIGFAELGQFVPSAHWGRLEGQWFTADPNVGSASLELALVAAEKRMGRYFMDFELDGPCAPVYQPGDIWQSSTDRFGKRGDLQGNLSAIEQAGSKTGCLSILTDGRNGFVVCSPGGRGCHFPPFRAPGQVDSTGAGDCFRAGLLHGLDSGMGRADALAYAAAAACLACQGFGATASIPTEQAVHDLVAGQPQTQAAYRSLI